MPRGWNYEGSLSQRFTFVPNKDFAVDVLVCPRCAGPRRILGAVTEPHAVRRLLAALGSPRSGETKEVTVLFADLVGYTALAERVEPTVLSRRLTSSSVRRSPTPRFGLDRPRRLLI